jgi:hypothetical protein
MSSYIYLLVSRTNFSFPKNYIYHKQKENHDLILNSPFPYPVDRTRRCSPQGNHLAFSPHEIIMHHMTFVRKDIKRKMMNSQNNVVYNIQDMLDHFQNYQLGQTVRIPPDMRNRKTILTENLFNIHF